MKKLIAVILASWFLSSIDAQTLSLETFVEESRIGMQKGYAIHYMNKAGWGIGTVFQSSKAFTTESNSDAYPFVGIEARVPIQYCNRLRLQFTPSIGFVNRNFLVFLPELQTEYLITDALGIGLGTGIRVREAAISFKVFFQPFKNSKS